MRLPGSFYHRWVRDVPPLHSSQVLRHDLQLNLHTSNISHFLTVSSKWSERRSAAPSEPFHTLFRWFYPCLVQSKPKPQVRKVPRTAVWTKGPKFGLAKRDGLRSNWAMVQFLGWKFRLNIQTSFRRLRQGWWDTYRMTRGHMMMGRMTNIMGSNGWQQDTWRWDGWLWWLEVIDYYGTCDNGTYDSNDMK